MVEVSDQVDYVTALITKFVSSTPKYAQKQFSSVHFFSLGKNAYTVIIPILIDESTNQLFNSSKTEYRISYSLKQVVCVREEEMTLSMCVW